jgi:glutamyl/glutaminyl-tRNA synthetase
MGILPEALRNYLLLLGWSASDGKTEILSTKEMIAQFSLERITKSPAVFDPQKLNWLNGEYIFALPNDERRDYFSKVVTRVLVRNKYLADDEVDLAKGLIDEILLVIIESKIGTAESKTDNKDKASLLDLARLIFDYDGAAVVRNETTRPVLDDPVAREVLVEFVRQVVAEPTLSFGRFQEIMKLLAKKTGKKGRALYHPVRIALTGEESGPELKKMIPIFENGAKLSLKRPIKSCEKRLAEFAETAKLFG